MIENSKPLVPWYYFVICMVAGAAPLLPSLGVSFFTDHYGCETYRFLTTCRGKPTLDFWASVTWQLGLLCVITIPMALIFLIGDVVINLNRLAGNSRVDD